MEMDNWSFVVSAISLVLSAISFIVTLIMTRNYNVVSVKNERAKALISFYSSLELNELSNMSERGIWNADMCLAVRKYVIKTAEKYNENKFYFDKDRQRELDKLIFSNVVLSENFNLTSYPYFFQEEFNEFIANDKNAKQIISQEIQNTYEPVLKYSNK